MLDSDVPPIMVYDVLWQRSLAEHPYDPQAQFRHLCALVRAWWKAPTVHPRLLGQGEQALLCSLAAIDVEVALLTMRASFPHERNPLERLDPFSSLPATAAAAAVHEKTVISKNRANGPGNRLSLLTGSKNETVSDALHPI
jgi:hypothetical protein